MRRDASRCRRLRLVGSNPGANVGCLGAAASLGAGTGARARLRRLSVACGEWCSADLRSAWFTWIESHERRSRVFGALSSLRHRNARLAFNRLRSLKATKTFLSRTTVF